MSLVSAIIKRGISTSNACYGKRNFKKFSLYNKRGTKIFKQQQSKNPDSEIPIDKRGVRDIGYTMNESFITIPEMIPNIIVPDLTNFKLKPYVSYRAPDVVQSEFIPKDLFNVVYAQKIMDDFKQGKLNENGSPKEPSEAEKQTPEEALIKAKQTGSDIFTSKLSES